MNKTTSIDKVVAVRVRQQVSEDAGKLFFLFTTSQVEEVLSDIVVQPLPFAPVFLQGLTYWRESLLPVIDLEERFAIKGEENGGVSRFVVVRVGAMENEAGGEVFRCVLKLSDEIFPMDISASGFVVENKDIGIEPSLVRGTYRLNENSYIVPNLVYILQNQSDVER